MTIREQLEAKYGKQPTSTTGSVRAQLEAKYGKQQPVVETQPDNKPLAKNVLNFIAGSEIGLGKTLGTALSLKSKDVKEAEKSQLQLDEMNQKVVDAIIAGKKQGKDTSKLERIYKENTNRNFNLSEITSGVIDKTGKQIAGEALGTVADIASFGTYGKALKLAPTLTKPEAFIAGAKKVLPESLVLGGAIGASESMKKDEKVSEIAKDAISSAIFSGLTSSLTGGLLSKSKVGNESKIKDLYQKALEQYKRGLQLTTKTQKRTADKIIPELLNKNWYGNKKQLLDKAEKGIKLAESQYEDLGKLKGYASTESIISNIDKKIDGLKTQTGRVVSVNKPQEKALKDLKYDILSVQAYSDLKSKQTFAQQEELRKLAQQYGKAVYELGKEATKKEAKAVDASIRELLSSKNPNYANINKLYTTSKNLENVITSVIDRESSRNQFGLYDRLSAIKGAMIGLFTTGNVGGAITAAAGLVGLDKLLKSTWWNTMNAVKKANLAKKLSEQKIEIMLNYINTLATQGTKAFDKIINND